ncbi:polyprenyl synthetase family protein [Streptomyces sp. YIM 98790]|uniref:polyprenyl synthetase family protein n=1 Tax=Streptomyces sp. YIM 98790 TaxID=2689077 RepID=UPI00140A6AE3|nr:polyprenyl synthetase family protein [Streptomyces sp. YIM 98790]
MAAPTPARPAAARRVDGTLRRCRELIRPALEDAVAQLPESPRLLAGYALGWHGPEGVPRPRGAPDAGGKGIRPALAVLAAEAVGGSAGQAVPGAVAVELVHAFTLVHDDIMDRDELRRRRPAVWRAFGTGPAVLTGDALLALALNVLVQHTRRHCREEAMRLLCAALSGLMHGQARDLGFETRPWRGGGAVTPEEYRTMAGDKTGALLGSAAALGALLAGADERQVTAMGAAGREFGLAFQIVDDLLGIWGDPARTGKPAGGDLRRGKKSLPVLLALDSGTSAAGRLAELLDGAGALSEETAPRAVRLIEEAGGRDLAAAEARAALERAGAALDALPLRPSARGELAALGGYALTRTG